MTEPLELHALTTVVVTVWMTILVTNRLDTVTGDVTQDFGMLFATKVHKLSILLIDCQMDYNNHFKNAVLQIMTSLIRTEWLQKFNNNAFV